MGKKGIAKAKTMAARRSLSKDDGGSTDVDAFGFYVQDMSDADVAVEMTVDSRCLKDNDFIKQKIRMSPADAVTTIATLWRDADFLCSLGIMDYSILLGVTLGKRQVQVQVQAGAEGEGEEAKGEIEDREVKIEVKGTQEDMEAVCDGEISRHRGSGTESTTATTTIKQTVSHVHYYIGIVDVLQTWGWQKQLERACKVWILRQNGNGISAMAPREYCARFKAKVADMIEHDEAMLQRTL